MTELPPLLRDQRAIDAQHLKLLSIFHFVAAGFALMGIAFLGFHFAMMHTFFSDPAMWAGHRQQPPPPEFLAMFRWFYLVFGTWFFASGILNVISGLCLRRRTHRTFSLIVSGLNCLHMPLGTVLGIFTIIVLMRDSVLEVYQT